MLIVMGSDSEIKGRGRSPWDQPIETFTCKEGQYNRRVRTRQQQIRETLSRKKETSCPIIIKV